jgi:predicted small secreted protein
MIRLCRAFLANAAPNESRFLLSFDNLRITMKKVFALAIAALVLAGCNTISGIGKDVQKVGQVVQGAGGK